MHIPKPVLSAHSFASNWQLLFLNQRKRENGRRNVFMTKSLRKNVPDMGIELGAACMPSELASDRATAPGHVLLTLLVMKNMLSSLLKKEEHKSYILLSRQIIRLMCLTLTFVSYTDNLKEFLLVLCSACSRVVIHCFALIIFSAEKQAVVIEGFNSTSRYLHDLLNTLTVWWIKRTRQKLD